MHMGLDMNAGWVNDEAKEDVVEFRWRKHAKLQEFMRQLWYQKQGKEAPEHVLGCEFNCENLYLDEIDIHELKQKLETFTLPEAKDGFFWGHEWQNETARESVAYDLDFCTKALAWLQEGRKVWYSCWW